MKDGFYTDTLSNGLTLLGERKGSAQSAAIGFFVKTGSRDETLKESGVSHFLEHMMFKGTPTRNALEVTFALGNIGAQANAFTSEENTVYYASILPEYFTKMQELLSDMLRPLLDPYEFSTEKKVILEEIALYQDRPHFYLMENALKDFFGEHPAGNSVLGSTHSIGAVTCDEMKSYFARRYAPGNIVLAASGNFNWNAFVLDADRLCGEWKNLDTPRARPQFIAQKKYKEFRKKDIQQVHVLFAAAGPSAQEEERYPLTLLSLMMGDGSGSRMYWDLVNPGIAESAGTDTDERDATGCFLASASTEPERMEKVVSIMKKIIASPLEFSESDLERAKTKLAARIVLGGELPMGRLMAIGAEWQYRKEVTPLKEVIRRVQSVTRNDIELALKKFPLEPLSEYRLLPE